MKKTIKLFSLFFQNELYQNPLQISPALLNILSRLGPYIYKALTSEVLSVLQSINLVYILHFTNNQKKIVKQITRS